MKDFMNGPVEEDRRERNAGSSRSPEPAQSGFDERDRLTGLRGGPGQGQLDGVGWPAQTWSRPSRVHCERTGWVIEGPACDSVSASRRGC